MTNAGCATRAGLVVTALLLAAVPAEARAAVGVTAAPAAPAMECEDYYAPPWGYPPDHCNYAIWDQPVYAAGAWYNGPLYWRLDNGERVFWINGRWQRHAWNGPLPRFIWGRKGFVVWHGRSHSGKHHWRFGSRHNWLGNPRAQRVDAAVQAQGAGPRTGRHRAQRNRRNRSHGGHSQ